MARKLMAMLSANPCASSGVHLTIVARIDGAAGPAFASPRPADTNSAAIRMTPWRPFSGKIEDTLDAAPSLNGLRTGRLVRLVGITAYSPECVALAPNGP